MDLRRAVHGVVRRVIYRWYQRQATSDGVADGECGSVTFIQNFGSALKLNVHLHILVLDGVYAWRQQAGLAFHRVPAPTDDEEPEDGQLLMMAASAAGRAALGLRAGRRPRCLRGPARLRRPLPPRCARSGYFNLHAGVAVAATDREALERLIRYTARPPLSLDRLRELDDGRVVVRFKRAWTDGTSAVVLTGVELLERLAALVGRPRTKRVVYGGVVAPAAPWRPFVVAHAPRPEERTALAPHRKHKHSKSPYISWRKLLWRVFAVDPFVCHECDGRMRVHAVVRGFWATRRVLGCLRVSSVVAGPAPARAPPLAAA